MSIFFFVILYLVLALPAWAQQPSPPPPQPVPIRSYADWAQAQELNCRATLQQMWQQAEEQIKQLTTEKQKLEEELKALKEPAKDAKPKK